MMTLAIIGIIVFSFPALLSVLCLILGVITLDFEATVNCFISSIAYGLGLAISICLVVAVA